MMTSLNHRLNGHAFNPAMLSNFLLALQRAPGAPLRMGAHNFERVRIVIIERDDPSLNADNDLDDDEDDDSPEVLPPLPRMRLAAPPRLVQGEILRGDDGTLYERYGSRIRALSSLAAGPRGEVLEVTHAPGANGQRPAAAPKTPEPVGETRATATAASTENTEAVPPPQVAPAAPVTPCRALFAEPGQWRVLGFGDIRTLVTAQLQHPERLRETHRLPCHVQVYESTTTQPISALAGILLGDETKAGEFVPLTAAMLQPLMLVGLLPPPRSSGRTPQHDKSWLLAGERVVRVTVAHDPSVSLAAAAARPAPAAKPEPAAEPVPPAPPALKTEIPAAMIRTAAMALPREEAILLLAQRDGLGARLRRFVHATIPAAELRSWQVRLSGRTIDEQLWVVAPPPGWRHDASVRDWVEQSLTLGSYALPVMLREWEIHWVRQGR